MPVTQPWLVVVVITSVPVFTPVVASKELVANIVKPVPDKSGEALSEEPELSAFPVVGSNQR
jgi:hypothetical protein